MWKKCKAHPKKLEKEHPMLKGVQWEVLKRVLMNQSHSTAKQVRVGNLTFLLKRKTKYWSKSNMVMMCNIMKKSIKEVLQITVLKKESQVRNLSRIHNWMFKEILKHTKGLQL